MARARLLSRTLGASRKFAAAGTAVRIGEFAQLLYTLIIPHTDDFGRMDGDAFTVKHAVFPTSKRSLTEFDTALKTLHESGLIVLYEFGDAKCLEVVGFKEHQANLHKRTTSKFPEPPGNSRKFPELPEIPGSRARAELKRTEEKRTEQNGDEPKAADAGTLHVVAPREVPVGQRSHHRGHAFCGRVCVPAFLHDEWRRLLTGTEDENDRELRAWELATDKASADEPVADALAWWRGKFKAWREPLATKASEHAANLALAERMAAGQRERALKAKTEAEEFAARLAARQAMR